MSQYSMMAERMSDLYPNTPEALFGCTPFGLRNLEAMRGVIAQHVVRLEGETNAQTVVDYACGNGIWSMGLFPKHKIFGFDLKEECLGYAQANARFNSINFQPVHICLDSQLPDINLLQKLDLRESADLVMCFALIENIDEATFNTVFSFLREACKPGGHLVVTFHNWRPFSMLYWVWALKGGYGVYKKHLGLEVSRDSMSDVRLKMKNLGWEHVKSGGLNPFPSQKLMCMPIPYVTYSDFFSYFYKTNFMILRRS